MRNKKTIAFVVPFIVILFVFYSFHLLTNEFGSLHTENYDLDPIELEEIVKTENRDLQLRTADQPEQSVNKTEDNIIPEPQPEPEERDSQLRTADQPEQSANKTEDNIIPEPEERDSQLRTADQPRQSANKTEDNIIPEPEERDSQLRTADQSEQSANKTEDDIIPEPEERDSQLRTADQPRQSANKTEDNIIPEPEERDSQLRIAEQPRQSANKTEDNIIPEPLIYAYTDVGPIDLPENYIIQYEPYLSFGKSETHVDSEIIYESFNLEPTDLHPFNDELLSLILGDLPQAEIEKQIETETLEEEPIVKELDTDIETPPVLTIISPENNDFYRSEVKVLFSVSDGENVPGLKRITRVYWISPDGTENDLERSDEQNREFSYSTIGYEGQLHIKVVVEKDNGLVDEKIILLKEDLKGPSIVIHSPVENSEIDDRIVIKGSVKPVNDEYAALEEIISLQIEVAGLDEIKNIDFDENGNFEVPFEDTGLDGLHLIKFSAMDKNNHISSLNFPIVFADRNSDSGLTAPAITISNPQIGKTYNSKVTVSGTVKNDDISLSSDQVEEFFWSLDGKNQINYIDFDDNGDFNFSISTVDVNHNLDIVFTAIRNDGMKRELLLSLVNDKIGPEIVLITPGNDEYFSNTIKVSGIVSDIVDGGNEVKSLYWSVSSAPDDNNLIFFEDDGTFDFEINTEDIDGLVNFQLTAYDLNNNSSTESVILNDGKKPPVILVETPETGAQYGAGIMVKGKISDPYSWNSDFGGIKSVSVLLEPYGALSAGESIEQSIPFNRNGSFEHIFRTDQRTGEQKLVIRVIAENGNVAEDSIEIIQGEFPISDFTITQGDRRLVLDWTTLPFIPNYYINYTVDGSDPSALSAYNLDNVKPPLILSNLSNGSLYSFLLTGETEDGIVQSDIIRSVPLSSNTLEPYAKGEFGYIEVSWLKAAGIDSYMVLRSSGNEPFLDISGVVNDNRYLDRTGIFGKSYQYKVLPYDFLQVESYPVTAELLSEPPERLTNTGSLTNLKPEVIKIKGDYAYVTSKEEGFYIVDISDPAKMDIRGFILLTGGEDLAISDDYAVVATGEDGFTVINISEPSSPRIVGSRKTTDALSVDIDDRYIYIGDGPKGLKIYSLEDPIRPPRVYFNDQFEAYDVTVADSILYVSSGEQGLNILDISNPEYPEFVGSFEDIPFYSSEIQGDFCYGASHDQGLNILNISDPARPFFCSNYKTENALSLMLADNHIMIADGEGGLLDVDVSDPYRPSSFESLELTYSSSVDVSDNLVLVADRSGLYTVESFQHGQSFKISSYKTEGDANSVTISGNYLYIADHSNGFIVSDLNQPGKIDENSILYTIKSDYAEQIVVSGERIYLADGSGGIKVYEIVENSLVLKEIIDIDGNAKKLFITDDYLLAAAGPGGVQGRSRFPGDHSAIVDSPEIPLEAADDKIRKFTADLSLTYPDVRDLIFLRDYLYIVDRKRGLIVIDFSSPDSPDRKMEISLPGARSIVHYEDRIYIGHADGITIYDISDKDYPEEIGFIESNYVEDIDIDGTVLYLAEGHAGLSVYDVKDIDRILKVSVCEDVFADSVTVSGEYAYIADSSGISVVKIYIPRWIVQRY